MTDDMWKDRGADVYGDVQRGLEPADGATRAELLERIKLNMRAAPRA